MQRTNVYETFTDLDLSPVKYRVGMSSRNPTDPITSREVQG